jgi:hypothetical protein
MEPFEKDQLSDQELDAMLPAWKSPVAPTRLRSAVFADPRQSWWRRVWNISFRVPLPVACAVAILFALGLWRWLTPPPPQVLPNTAAASSFNPSEMQPVSELRSRIIRRRNDQN